MYIMFSRESFSDETTDKRGAVPTEPWGIGLLRVMSGQKVIKFIHNIYPALKNGMKNMMI